jgi:hypothetical protein
MQIQALDKAETALRRAATAQDYSEVDLTVVAYCDAARIYLATLPEQDTRRRAALARVLDVLEWARLMVYTSRAGRVNKLERVATLDRYLGSQNPAASPSTLINL